MCTVALALPIDHGHVHGGTRTPQPTLSHPATSPTDLITLPPQTARLRKCATGTNLTRPAIHRSSFAALTPPVHSTRERQRAQAHEPSPHTLSSHHHAAASPRLFSLGTGSLGTCGLRFQLLLCGRGSLHKPSILSTKHQPSITHTRTH